MFVLRQGKYTIPNFGSLDTSKGVSNEQMLALYLNKSFPFISITPKAVDFLKKQKLDKKVVATLINRAKTAEEVEILLKVKKDKTLQSIAETKLASLS